MRPFKKHDHPVTPTCLECGKLATSSPSVQFLRWNKNWKKRVKPTNKRRRRRLTLHWKDNDSSTSSQSSESMEREKKNCLKVDNLSSKSNVSSFSSTDENKYYQLFDMLNELHEEARKLQYSNNRYKRENRWLENISNQLET